jgi:hypothetical protein
MKTVYTDYLHRMQPLDWLAIFLGERDVSPDVPNRAARFHSAYHISLCQMLVFQTTAAWTKIPRSFSTRSACRESLSPTWSNDGFCFMPATILLSYV